MVKEKNVVTKVKETAGIIIKSMIMAYVTSPVFVYADDSYLKPLNTLKTIAISIVVAAGALVLIYGVVKFGTSFQKMDQNGEHQAIYTIISGVVMIGVSAIVGALT